MVFDVSGFGEDWRALPESVPAPVAGARATSGAGYRFPDGSRALLARLDGIASGLFQVRRVGPADLTLTADVPSSVALGLRGRLRVVSGARIAEPLPVEVTRVRGGGEIRLDDVGVRLLDPPLRATRQLYALLDDLRRQGKVDTPPTDPGVVEHITEPCRVDAVVRSLVRNGCAGTLHGADGRTCRVRPVGPVGGADPSRPLLLLRWALDGEPPACPIEIRLVGFNSVFVLPVGGVDHDGPGRLVTRFPGGIVRRRRRVIRRVPASAGLEVVWRHAVLPSLEVRRPLRDISLDGLSFWTSPSDDLLLPGLPIDDLTVREKDRVVARFVAEVRHIHQDEDDAERGRVVGGARIISRTDRDRTRWADFVQDLQNPTSRTGRTSVGEAWDLYDASGYFRLSNTKPEDFAPLRSAFARSMAHLDAAPDLGCQVVYPSERGIEASISIVKLYQGTYFPGQLAKRPRDPALPISGRRVLRDIHLRAYEHLQADPDFRWLLVFVHESASWTEAAYREFPRRYERTEHVWVEPFVAYTGRCGGAARLAPDAAADTAACAPARGIEMGPATPGEIHLLLERIHRTRGSAYAEALDLVPIRFALAGLTRCWAEAGLTRQREIVVARRDGRALAAALFECGEKGLHLFNMFDSTRVYALQDEPAGDVHDARTALLCAAHSWYAARGRDGFTYFLEEGDEAHATAAGLRALGRANQLVMSSAIVPDFLECIYEVTSPGENH